MEVCRSMKIARTPSKNICEIDPFFGARNYIQINKAKMPHLSGLPPSGRRENRAERAVIMPEFLKSGGVPR